MLCDRAPHACRKACGCWCFYWSLMLVTVHARCLMSSCKGKAEEVLCWGGPGSAVSAAASVARGAGRRGGSAGPISRYIIVSASRSALNSHAGILFWRPDTVQAQTPASGRAGVLQCAHPAACVGCWSAMKLARTLRRLLRLICTADFHIEIRRQRLRRRRVDVGQRLGGRRLAGGRDQSRHQCRHRRRRQPAARVDQQHRQRDRGLLDAERAAADGVAAGDAQRAAHHAAQPLGAALLGMLLRDQGASSRPADETRLLLQPVRLTQAQTLHSDCMWCS